MPRSKKIKLKKQQKLQAKKRKLEAFLNLVNMESIDDAPQPPKKSRNTLAGSFKALKDELKRYQAKQDIEPALHLTDVGQSALVNFSSINQSIKSSIPLFFEDIYNLLLKSLLGPLSPFSLKWARLDRPQYITKTVVFEIEGLSESDIFQINSELSEKCKILQYAFEVVSSKHSFATELSTFHLSAGFDNHAEKNSTLFPADNNIISKNSTNEKNVISKLHLLLSPIQLAMENFPLPPSVFAPSKCHNYIFSKESYTPVTDKSPMFALDCEMCKTSTGANEVTRVAIVDENLKTVYHTLVKPQTEIVDYLTKYSGITAYMLNDVTTTLTDVHKEMQKILPSDAILCGQSLNCDLHALKMIHPYVIDTSVIFNLNGNRSRKTSLKQLSRVFLNKSIQSNPGGHHPVEDSIATMKLVQLKLQNGLTYGDAVFRIAPEIAVKDNSNEVAQENKHSSSDSRFSNFVTLNSGPEHCGFFERIAKFSKKKICLIGNKHALDNYCLEDHNDRILKKVKSHNKNVMKSTLKNLNDFDLIISHLTLKDEISSLVDIIDRIKKVYESFPNRSLFLLIAGKCETDKTFNHSCCMTVVKTVKE